MIPTIVLTEVEQYLPLSYWQSFEVRDDISLSFLTFGQNWSWALLAYYWQCFENRGWYEVGSYWKCLMVEMEEYACLLLSVFEILKGTWAFTNSSHWHGMMYLFHVDSSSKLEGDTDLHIFNVVLIEVIQCVNWEALADDPSKFEGVVSLQCFYG